MLGYNTLGEMDFARDFTAIGITPYAWVPARFSYSITTTRGEYSWSGFSAGLTADRQLNPATGEYAASEEVAHLTASRRLQALLGEYTATGNAVSLTADRRLVQTAAGEYTLTYADAVGLVVTVRLLRSPRSLVPDALLSALVIDTALTRLLLPDANREWD